MKPNRTWMTLAGILVLAWTSSNFSLEAGPVSGRVVGWNYRTNSNDLPPNLTNVIAISAAAAGNYYSQNLALRNDGTVIAWGKNVSGQTKTNVPVGLTDVVAVAAGGAHYMALKRDATVVVWIDATTLAVPANVTNVAAIAAGGGGYSLALTKSGAVISWTHGNQNYAVPPGLGSNVTAIAAGGSWFLALKSNSTVVAWGANNLGQTNMPAGLSNLTAVAADWIHSVGLKSDGTVVSWGGNLGDGQTNVPVGLSNVVAVAAGGAKGAHSLVLKSDGTVVSWGAGQTSAAPAYVSNVVAIAAGDYYNLAIVADPQISTIHFTNQQPVIRFRSWVGQHYSLEYSDDLLSSNWTSVIQSNFQGTGGNMVVTDTNTANGRRFYRLRQW